MTDGSGPVQDATKAQWERTHAISRPSRSVIPVEAVEAAVRVLKGSGWIDDLAREALEAAAPYMRPHLPTHNDKDKA